MLKSFLPALAVLVTAPVGTVVGQTYTGSLDNQPDSRVMMVVSAEVDFHVMAINNNKAGSILYGGDCFGVPLKNGNYEQDDKVMKVSGVINPNNTTGDWWKNGQKFHFTAKQRDPKKFFGDYLAAAIPNGKMAAVKIAVFPNGVVVRSKLVNGQRNMVMTELTLSDDVTSAQAAKMIYDKVLTLDEQKHLLMPTKLGVPVK